MKKQPEKPQPGSEKTRKPYFSAGTVKAVFEEQEKEREYQARQNPKGVPVIFPGYD